MAYSLDDLLNAISQVESSNNYQAVGPANDRGQRAYGRWQVMDFNIPTWTKRYYGEELTPSEFLLNEDAQEAVARGEIGRLAAGGYQAPDIASIWFTGRPLREGADRRDVTGTTGREYANKVLGLLGEGSRTSDLGGGERLLRGEDDEEASAMGLMGLLQGIAQAPALPRSLPTTVLRGRGGSGTSAIQRLGVRPLA